MANKFTFRGTQQEVSDHIRWCRANLGARGWGWEFVGSLYKVEVQVIEPKLLTYYTLKFGHKNENN